MVSLDGGKYGSNNGFDHVFQYPDGSVTIVIDSKQVTNGTVSLSTDGAGGVPQMSDAWINNVLDRLDKTSDAFKAIDKAILNGTLYKAVAGVDRSTGQLLVVRIK